MIQSSVTSGETKKRLKLLLLYLAEANFDNSQIASRKIREEEISFPSDEDSPSRATIQRVKSDLLLLLTSANVQQLENYLNESSDC